MYLSEVNWDEVRDVRVTDFGDVELHMPKRPDRFGEEWRRIKLPKGFSAAIKAALYRAEKEGARSLGRMWGYLQDERSNES